MAELWSIPFHLPKPAPGETLDLVEVMERQAAEQSAGTPEYWTAQFELMKVYGMSGRIEESLAVLKTMMESDADLGPKARALYVAASSIEQTGEYERAAWFYRAVNSMKSEDRLVLYFGRNNLAYCLNQLGRNEEAADEARAAIAQDPNIHNAHKNLGVALEGMGDLIAAAESYREASRLNPLDRRAHKHLETMVTLHPELAKQLEWLAAHLELYRDPVRALLSQDDARNRS